MKPTYKHSAIKEENMEIKKHWQELSEMEQNNQSVENLGFSVRTMNCLKRAGIRTVEELKERNERGELMKIRGMGLNDLRMGRRLQVLSLVRYLRI